MLRMPEAVRESMEAARWARHLAGPWPLRGYTLDAIEAAREQTRAVLAHLRALRAEEGRRFGVRP